MNQDGYIIRNHRRDRQIPRMVVGTVRSSSGSHDAYRIRGTVPPGCDGKKMMHSTNVESASGFDFRDVI